MACHSDKLLKHFVLQSQLCSTDISHPGKLTSDPRDYYFKGRREKILDLLLRCADKGFPLTLKHVTEAAQIVIQSLPNRRQNRLPFKNGRLGYKWVKSFYERHNGELRFAVPNNQEAKRFASVNTETLATHFSTLEALVQEYGFDADRVWNCDETGVSPSKEMRGSVRKKRFLRRDSASDCVNAAFAYSNRITIMPSISASGLVRPTVWVFKGAILPVREIAINGRLEVQTLTSFLPANSLINIREDVAGVDSGRFYEWVIQFVTHAAHLTTGDKKILLTFDRHRCHMSVRVLEYLRRNNIVVYAIPSHSSGKTQPLDTCVFRNLKHHVNQLVSETITPSHHTGMVVYELCATIKMAYIYAFTPRCIISAFKSFGLWPVDRTVLMSVPRPRDNHDNLTLMSVEEMEALFMDKRKCARYRILGESGTVSAKRGYVDKSRGIVKNRRKEQDETEKIVRAEECRWRIHAQLAGKNVEEFRCSVRPSPERRAAASRRAAAVAMLQLHVSQ